MAAGWRGAWWSRVSSSTEKQEGGGAGDPVQVRQAYCHANQRGGLVGYHYKYNNCGMSTTTSGTASLPTTAYTTSSSASYPQAAAGRVSGHPLQSPPHAAAPPVLEVEDAGLCQERVTDEDKVKTREHIRDLIHEFRGAAGSGSDAGSAMDKWLSELRVSWVLHLTELEASARRKFISRSRRLRHTAHTWAMALHMISRSIVSLTGWSAQDLQEQGVWPTDSEFAGFVAATFLQMLPFVDAVAALDISDNNPSSDDDDDHGIVSGHGGVVTSAHKFQTLIQVRDALSGASEQVQLWESWLRSSSGAAEATRISRLLLAKLDKLDEAIRDTRDYIRTQSTMSLKHDSTSGLDASPDIHKVTRSVISYITVLSASYDRLVDPPIVLESISLRGDDVEALVPGDENATSSIHLIMLMMRSLEKKLTRVSQSFPDPSLRLLFLLNNFYFVWHQLRTNRLLDAPMQALLTRRIDGYIYRYLQASWTPVLKPLHNRTFCCFMRYSSLRKFESKFEKTYAAQKLWKVPDPELREELRTAIVDKVISAFTRFLEDNGVGSSSKVTPEKLEEMLEELFEG